MSKTLELTDSQKETYLQGFKKLIESSSASVIELWKKNPQITWIHNEPVFVPADLPNKLQGKQADGYVTLDNKRLSRTL